MSFSLLNKVYQVLTPEWFFTKRESQKSLYLMKRITLNIPDNQYAFFLELVKKLGLEKIKEEAVDTQQEEVLQGIAQGLREVRHIEEGNMKGTRLKDFLDEL